jgi:hypothetical protein
LGGKLTLEPSPLRLRYSIQDALDEWSLPFQIFADAAGVFRLKAELQIRVSLAIRWALSEMVSKPQHLNRCRMPTDANVKLVGANSIQIALKKQMTGRQITAALEPMCRKHGRQASAPVMSITMTRISISGFATRPVTAVLPMWWRSTSDLPNSGRSHSAAVA